MLAHIVIYHSYDVLMAIAFLVALWWHKRACFC